jgi:RTX calcium-binding nonapeptide repeat (4 copies)
MILDILAAHRLYGEATGPARERRPDLRVQQQHRPIDPGLFRFHGQHPSGRHDLGRRAEQHVGPVGWSAPATINLNPGTFSSANAAVNYIAIAADTAIGGGGNDTIIGNSYNSVLSGGGGNDTLVGGTGSDQLIGGPGTDTANYSSSSAGVSVSLLNGAGAGGDDKATA